MDSNQNGLCNRGRNGHENYIETDMVDLSGRFSNLSEPLSELLGKSQKPCLKRKNRF